MGRVRADAAARRRDGGRAAGLSVATRGRCPRATGSGGPRRAAGLTARSRTGSSHRPTRGQIDETKRETMHDDCSDDLSFLRRAPEGAAGRQDRGAAAAPSLHLARWIVIGGPPRARSRRYCCASVASAGSDVFRCRVDGIVTYQSHPCPDGRPRARVGHPSVERRAACTSAGQADAAVAEPAARGTAFYPVRGGERGAPRLGGERLAGLPVRRAAAAARK
ncbi:MAG: DUF4124 domain-containing protein [Comamonadaceae bacterium]|nr:DUF4124 domain-containing protein [Comamonadaceae bacterium]